MNVSIKQAKQMVLDILRAGLVPNLRANPGVGKSDLVRTIADENNLKVIDLRLSQLDPTDLNGYPTLSADKSRSHYAPPSVIPLESDPIPDGYKGWLLFLDEFTSAPLSVQAAAYKVILDRMIGEHNIHKNVAIVCAGNLVSDKAIVYKLSTAMQSRLVHVDIETQLEPWFDWALDNAIDNRIIGFLRFRPELLHKFDPSHNDATFACPRTWEFLSRLLKIWGAAITDEQLPSMAGTIGEGPAMEFFGFTTIYSNLPTIQQITSNPDTVDVTEEPSALYALTALLSSYMTVNNAVPLMKFVSRLPAEFQVITVQTTLRNRKELLGEKPVKDWIDNNADEMLGKAA